MIPILRGSGTGSFPGSSANRVIFTNASGVPTTSANFKYQNDRLLVQRTSTPSGLGDYTIKSDWQTALGATDIVASGYFYLKNTGSATPSGGHGIAALCFAEDTSSGKHNLYAIEGKVIGRNGTSTQFYQGFLGQSIYVGTSRNITSTFVGVNATVYNYQDEAQTTPYAGVGLSVCFLAPAIVGGNSAQNFSFIGNNVLQNNDDILMKKTSSQGYIKAFSPDGTQTINMFHDNDIAWVATASDYLGLLSNVGIAALAEQFVIGGADPGIDYFLYFNGYTTAGGIFWREATAVFNFVSDSSNNDVAAQFGVATTLTKDSISFLGGSSLCVSGESVCLAIIQTRTESTTASAVVSIGCDTGANMGGGVRLGSLNFFGNANNFLQAAALIQAVTPQAWSNTSSPADLIFKVTKIGSRTEYEAMRLTSEGLLGIGNNSPQYYLDVFGDVLFGAVSGVQGSRIMGRGEHTSAPAGSLSTAMWELSVYDDGVAPVFRVRYDDAGIIKTGDLALV